MKVTKKCWQLNTLAGDRNTIHRPEVTQAIKLVDNRPFTITQRKLSPPFVESRDIMIDNFWNIFFNIGNIL